MRIILFILGFLFISFWLTLIIAIGVNAGLKTFYQVNFQNKKEDRK